MIKFAVASIWICAATIGSMYYAFSTSTPPSESEPVPEFFGGLDYVKTDVISVPVVRDHEIQGYFLARLVYTAEPAKLHRLTLPASALLVDHVYSYLYGNPQIDFAHRNGLDLDAFRHGIRNAINTRVGDRLIHEILVEQVDFLSKEEIRDNTIRRRSAVPKGG